MAVENRELTKKAREALKDKWNTAVGTTFVFFLISSLANEISLIIGGPLQLGYNNFSLNISRGKKAEFAQLFDGFKNFANALVANLLMVLFVVLWSLLLIIPGIIAAISYSQTFYLMADDKTLKGGEAIKRSKEMMNGYKMKYFMLCLRFTGWFLLSIISLGIGFLWLAPYAQVSFANFYNDIRKKA